MDDETRGAFEKAGRGMGISPALLAAVAEVETGNRAFALVEDRREPLIRFEGHYFDRRLAGDARDRARATGLADPRAGAVRNPATQADRWRMLERAIRIDRRAAYESTSWGLGQVMGAHWQWLGFTDIDALVARARSGPSGQIELMARYIGRAGLLDALSRHDWKTFARGYNGPGYAANSYDRKLGAAYQRLAAMFAPAGDAGDHVKPRNLRLGARGEDVRRFQSRLNTHGADLRLDGIFGPATLAALRAFQRTHGLLVDGIAGPLTLKVLEMPLTQPKPTSLAGIIAQIVQRLLLKSV